MMTGPSIRSGDRADYLAELAALLWPAPARAHLGRGGRTGYAVVPSAARPRLLVPMGAARAAASAIRYATEAPGPRARIRQRLLAAAFRVGLGGLAFRDRLVVADGSPVAATGTAGTAATGPLGEHLAELLGRRVLLSLYVGPARANRKPVLQLLGADGALLGYAKLGVDPLTRALVDAEAAALHRLAGCPMPGVVVPSALHHGRWGDHALLVQSALPVGLPRASAAARVAAEQAAMRAVSAALGVRSAGLAGSGYLELLSDRVAALGDRPEATRLRAILATLAEADPELLFGCWHGDWNGGNSAVLADGRVLVWDWERFTADVPVGYDALHRRLQTAITRAGVDPRVAAGSLLDAAAEVLAPFGQAARSAGSVAMLYLVELATRYLADRQAEAGARLGHVDTWLLPAVEERLGVKEGTVN